jgi:transcriptional regulator with XRE-family HTH domain
MAEAQDAASAQRSPFGAQLRAWRQRRRMSQLAFALDAEISQKHLSFIETGRSAPSREMVVRLAEVLEVPLRERNALLVAAGYAPLYVARPLDDRALAPMRAAIDLLLAGHAPFPAIAIDGHWTMLAANAPAGALLALARDPVLVAPPVNVLRLSLHPAGLAPLIVNLAEWRVHLLDRVRRQVRASGEAVLAALLAELESYPGGEGPEPTAAGPAADVMVPFRLRLPAGELSFFSTSTVFGTPLDVTLSEIAIESFFPADEATRVALAGGGA